MSTIQHTRGWRPAKFQELQDKTSVTIYIGPGAWAAAEKLARMNGDPVLLAATGNDDPLAAIDGGSTGHTPLVVTGKELADRGKLKQLKLANKATMFVYLETFGPVDAEQIRELVTLLATQAPAAEIYQDGSPLHVLKEVMEQAGMIKRQAMSAAELREMGPSEKADLLLDRYNGDLAINDASDDFYRYNGAIWETIADKALRREMVKVYRETDTPYSAGAIASVIDTLRLSVPVLTPPDRQLIGFKNGVFSLAERVFREHDKADGLLHALNVDYREPEPGESLVTHAPNFNRWLTQAGRSTTKSDRILAALFMVLANRYDWQLFLEVTGPGGSGKSVFAKICTMLAGEGNTTSGTIDAIENARERAALVGYSLIVLPDQPRYMGDGAGLKAITGGDAVMIDPKHKAPFSVQLPAVVLAVNNNPMAFGERSGGISRRRVIFSFAEVVPEHERDEGLPDKIADELPVIIRHLLNRFADPTEAKQLLHEQQRSAEALEIKREADSLVDFCGYLLASSQPDGLLVGNANITPPNPRKYLYHAYLAFMAGMAHQRPLSLTAFGKAMPYAMGEYGRRFIKARTKHGMRTNLDLNEESSVDWIHTAGGDG